MNTICLVDILETCVLNYFQQEHSKKGDIFAIILSLVFGQKHQIKTKAEHYLQTIKNLTNYSNDWIFFYVADDLNEMRNVLAANRKLRVSFMEGLCKYLYVSDAEIMTTAFTLNEMNATNLDILREMVMRGHIDAYIQHHAERYQNYQKERYAQNINNLTMNRVIEKSA